MKKGIPVTTVVLVVFLLGALMMVSRMVTPPPAAPPVEVTPAQVQEQKADHKEDMEKYRQQMAEEANKYRQQAEDAKQRKKLEDQAVREIQQKALAQGKTAPSKPFNPDATDVSGDFVKMMPMGAEGGKATDEAVANARAINQRTQELADAAKANASKKDDGKKPVEKGLR